MATKRVPTDRERYRLDQLARGACIHCGEKRYTMTWPDRGARRSVVSQNIVVALVNEAWVRKPAAGEPYMVITGEGRRALARKAYRN